MLTPPNARALTRNSAPSAPLIVTHARELVVFLTRLAHAGTGTLSISSHVNASTRSHGESESIRRSVKRQHWIASVARARTSNNVVMYASAQRGSSASQAVS